MTIDWWTLGLQTINIAILIWLLGRFFWRPVAAMIEQRRATAQSSLDAAEAARREAEEALADIARTRAGFAAEREAILATAQDEAAKASQARAAEAAAAAAALQEAARASIAQEKLEAEAAWARRAETLAIDIAGRLAARLDGAAVRAAFVDWLLQGIRAQPEAVRRAAAAEGATLEATTATPLDPAEEERYRASICEALGAQPTITFTVDSALIAGLELRGPHLEVGNSWRADLARMHKDLAHGG